MCRAHPLHSLDATGARNAKLEFLSLEFVVSAPTEPTNPEKISPPSVEALHPAGLRPRTGMSSFVMHIY
jgi:hypothetical protein